MTLLFSCRACGSATCDCARDCSAPVPQAHFPAPSYTTAPYAQAACGSRVGGGDARLAQAADALRSASAAVNRERMLRDRGLRGLCPNGQTVAARRLSMKLYMRRYR